MIELYIDGKKVDLTTEISVKMNYELEKLQNPTTIKNNFSKTIQLQATPTNNEIFNFYYKLDKLTTGTGFDANKRIPFQLFRDCNLIETGYLQLNNIKYINNNYVYEITLYGGLGDFFYNLSYDEEGNDKSLADLYYGHGKEDEYMTFQMNADTVVQSWYSTNVAPDVRTMGGVITFIPTYNGLYDDFDNDKVLINTYKSDIFVTTATTDNVEYKTINGYAYADLNREYTEWEMRDLRCYKQRPALRMRAFIDAICNPENNGGYEVELDKEYFFNKDNPYYNDTWIALPLLNSDSEEFPKTTLDLDSQDVTDPIDINLVSTPSEPSSNQIIFDGYATDEMAAAGGNASIDMKVKFSLKTTTDNYNGVDSLLLTTTTKEGRKTVPLWTGIGVWVEAELGGDIVGISDCLVFCKSMYKGEERILPTINDFKANFINTPVTNFIMVDGAFARQDPDYRTFIFQNADGLDNTFVLELNNVPNYDDVKYRIKTKRWFSHNPTGMDGWATPYMFALSGGYVVVNSASLFDIEVTSTLNVNKRKSLQGAKITKRQLLKNKITPASILTSFTKLFGLYFYKDCIQKKISILTRNKFFENGELIDLDNKINWDKEVKIEPLMFDKKWYLLTTPALETTKMKNYKGDYYEAEYGQKRINTNYNFNTDIEDIYKDNQFQNVITMLDSNKYYRHFPSYVAEEFAPAFCNDGIKYHLFKTSGGSVDYRELNDIEYSKYDLINKNIQPVQWSNLASADVMAKLCCFDVDNDKQSLNDLNVSLVFFNGNKALQDTDGNKINYIVSNDIPIMDTINEGTPMYLYSNSKYNDNLQKICEIPIAMPNFSRYFTFAGNVIESLDFGLPFETYINENYTEETTLYDKFWKKFYTDQFSSNTRKVTAYVKFDDLQLNNKALSNFYYFENSYWLLNKIIDYDIAYPYKQVKCEFIKINNMNNYTNGQQIYRAFYEIYIDGEDYWLEDMTKTAVEFGGSFSARVITDYGVYSITIKQDGIDITNRCWDSTTDTINIQNITGDIDIDIIGNAQPLWIYYDTQTDVLMSDYTTSISLIDYYGRKYKIFDTPILEDKRAEFNPTHRQPVYLEIETNSPYAIAGTIIYTLLDNTTGNLAFETEMSGDSKSIVRVNIDNTVLGNNIKKLQIIVEEIIESDTGCNLQINCYTTGDFEGNFVEVNIDTWSGKGGKYDIELLTWIDNYDVISRNVKSITFQPNFDAFGTLYIDVYFIDVYGEEYYYQTELNEDGNAEELTISDYTDFPITDIAIDIFD